MPDRILVSTKGSSNTWNLLSHFIISFQKKLFDDVFIFRTRSNKSMRFGEQNKYGWIPNPKTGRKKFMNEALPKFWEAWTLEDACEFEVADPGGGRAGGLCSPPFLFFFILFFFYNSEVYEQKTSIERVRN